MRALPPAELRARLAPAAQRAALTPFPAPRIHAAPWQLNRVPLDFRELTAAGWAGRLALGEQLPAYQGDKPLPDLPADENSAPAPRASTARSAAALSPPETRSFTWSFASTGAIGVIQCVSTPVIPWPFRIIGLSIEATPLAVPVKKITEIQLYAVDSFISGTVTDIPGVQLIPRNLPSATAFGLRLHVSTNAAASQQTALYNLATAAIGATVTDPYKRVCFALKQIDAITQTFQGSLTVEQWHGPGTADITVRPTARPVPRASTAPGTSPGTGAGAGADCTPPSFGSLQYWINQVGIISRTPANAGGRAARLAEAQRNAECLQRIGAGGVAFSATAARSVTTGAGGLGTGQRWTLDEYPGLSFATAAEAQVYASARAVAYLPASERAAASEAVRRAAASLTYGAGETATPARALLAPLPYSERPPPPAGIVRSPGDPSRLIEQGYVIADRNFPCVLFKRDEPHDRFHGERIPGCIA